MQDITIGTGTRTGATFFAMSELLLTMGGKKRRKWIGKNIKNCWDDMLISIQVWLL